MRRLPRILFKGFAAISLVLCAATASQEHFHYEAGECVSG